MVYAWEQAQRSLPAAGVRPAGPPPPLGHRGSADQLLTLQRQAGNAATATHLAQGAPASEEVLPESLADHATAYYAELGDYRIEQHHRIQAKLGLAPTTAAADGTFPIEDGFVQAVARWQRNDRGNPRLPVDGIADFRTLARMFPFGLSTAGQSHAYAAAGRTELVDRWGDLTASERLETMERMLWQAMDRAEKLPGAAGMPRPTFAHANERIRLWFDPTTWTIALSPGWFDRGPMTHAKVPFVIGGGLHELRHAEQNFMVIRTAIGAAIEEGVADPATMVAKELDVPLHVARAAAAAPLPSTSIEAMMAGSIRTAREDATLRRKHAMLGDAVREADAANQQAEAEPFNAANQRVLVTLENLRNQLREDYYVTAPAEQDADTVGRMVEDDLTGETP